MAEVSTLNHTPTLTAKDFASDQEVRWCPGCGDYSILKQVQTVLPELGIPREKFAFISGIGCSSRFPYYMEAYGLHSIHGRATAIAAGLKMIRPDLSVWIISGDGDALSIGTNHTLQLIRRNFDVQLLVFNNQIYGLTKGQYSPTSEEGKVTKSTPMGSIDHPFNPCALVLGADATFVARSLDRDPKHLQMVLKRAAHHRGTSFVEIYQNCNIFNDGAFFVFTEKETKFQKGIYVEHGKPMLFDNGKKGIKLDGTKPIVVDMSEASVNDLWIHDETDIIKANILTRMFEDPDKTDLPRPFGVLYVANRPCYEDLMKQQIQDAIEQKGKGDITKLINSGDTWVIA
ncbi:MAG: 2-oxoacid:ferredoxin oxidoreductase subunit beta [Bacteroidia bacterium]|nr:2-oxoacid:ferredoxin oxidoreductase subunit beta [Bacteroidia bacterium]MDW8301518.1 2-oxoacid:ferredoxin oxidoreductase subunit beta [Bacteroidia bacterium]